MHTQAAGETKAINSIGFSPVVPFLVKFAPSVEISLSACNLCPSGSPSRNGEMAWTRKNAPCVSQVFSCGYPVSLKCERLFPAHVSDAHGVQCESVANDLLLINNQRCENKSV